MKLFNITQEEKKQKFTDKDGNPISFGSDYTYTATINQNVLDLILDKKESYKTMQNIRQLIANLYNSNTYECHLFSMIAEADKEHQELIFNILETIKESNTRFIIVNDIAPLLIEKFHLNQ